MGAVTAVVEDLPHTYTAAPCSAPILADTTRCMLHRVSFDGARISAAMVGAGGIRYALVSYMPSVGNSVMYSMRQPRASSKPVPFFPGEDDGLSGGSK